MYFQDAEFQQLHAVFQYLAASPYAVTGAWPAGTHRSAPRFIRRGPLLLSGTGQFAELYVLNPADATVSPVTVEGTSNEFPKVDKGEAIRVTQVDGPWWDLLRTELADMVREVRTHQATRAGSRDRRMNAAEEKLQKAADAVNAWMQRRQE